MDTARDTLTSSDSGAAVEPIINATMCGKRGVWPPYLRGDMGYITLMAQIALGIIRTVQIIQEMAPNAVFVHADAAGITRASQPELEPLAAEDQLHRCLCYDLITGKVRLKHPLFPCCCAAGGAGPGPHLVSLIDYGRLAVPAGAWAG